MPTDPTGWMRLLGSLGAVRLGKGVVSKSSRIALSVGVVLIVCASRVSGDLIQDACLGLIALITVGGGW